MKQNTMETKSSTETKYTDSLYCDKDQSFTSKIKILQYNVDMAMREEQHTETKWESRKKRVEALINDVGADIVCLQEMRSLPNTEPVINFLTRLDKYRFELAYRNPSELSFGQAILYDPKKFYPIQTVKKWLSSTPDFLSDDFTTKASGTTGFGSIVFGVQFIHVFNGKAVRGVEPFWVFNTHFVLEENAKTESCKTLLTVIPNIVNKQEFILTGDFNFFPDLDGDSQRTLLTNHWQDLGSGAVTLSGRKVEGTFVGYDHDAFKADLNNMVSRLDHIFTSERVRGEQTILYTKTMLDNEPTELTTRDYPSDHLPLVCTVTL